jgi:regulator of sigma E protease
MSSDLLPTLLSNVWSIFLVVLFFGGSIFVHELGHFLAARRRGAHVARFSIGFGPKIISWHDKTGTEYCLCWLPLGGYVALPQLADMRGIEGESDIDPAQLPQLGYATKLIVFSAGAAFNVLFAFLLACIVWIVGQPQNGDLATTRIGYVSATLDAGDSAAKGLPSPAALAGLQVGDTIRAVDGQPMKDWSDIMSALTMGSGHTDAGERQVIFTIERAGQVRDVVLHPRLSGDENYRKVGIGQGYALIVHEVPAGSNGEKCGFKPEDEILDFDGQLVLNITTYQDYLQAHHDRPVIAHVKRGGQPFTLTIPSRPDATLNRSPLGLVLTTGYQLTHPSPFAQVGEYVEMTFRTIWSLLDPHSDIGLSKMSGPVGIVHIFHEAAQLGIQAVLGFTILINVNLAIFNLLPIPVLDGGHIVFATIAYLRGRALPMNFILTTQSVFMALIFSMVIYISIFDIGRWRRDAKADRAEAAAAAAAAPASPGK